MADNDGTKNVLQSDAFPEGVTPEMLDPDKMKRMSQADLFRARSLFFDQPEHQDVQDAIAAFEHRATYREAGAEPGIRGAALRLFTPGFVPAYATYKALRNALPEGGRDMLDNTAGQVLGQPQSQPTSQQFVEAMKGVGEGYLLNLLKGIVKIVGGPDVDAIKSDTVRAPRTDAEVLQSVLREIAPQAEQPDETKSPKAEDSKS